MFCLVIVFLLIFSINSGTVKASSETIPVYTLQEAVNIAIKYNEMLKSLDYVIMSKQVAVQESNDFAKKISDREECFLKGGKVKYYLPFDANIQYEIARLDKEEKIKTISLTTLNAYMDVLYFQEAVGVVESGVKRAEEQLEIAYLNYDLGKIAISDVLSAEVQLCDVKSELELVKNMLKIKKMELNQVMNKDLTSAFNLETVNFSNGLLFDDSEVKQGLDNNITLKIQALEIKSIDKLLEVTKMYYPENTYSYQSAYSIKLTKQSIFNVTKAKTELGLRSQQIKINTLKEKYQVMNKQVEKLKERYNLMLKEYKEGRVSDIELAYIDQAYKRTSLDELEVFFDYYRAVYDYMSMLGIKWYL